jgi:hypothetical protein
MAFDKASQVSNIAVTGVTRAPGGVVIALA